MLFPLLMFFVGLWVGGWATQAVERLPVDDEFHYQLFSSEEDMPPPEWWMRIPFIWFFVKPPDGTVLKWYDRIPLVSHFLYAWKFSSFWRLSFPAHCRNCRHRLSFRERIPVLSFISLSGRCPSCRIKIPARQPLIELSTGVLFALFAARFGPTWIFVAMAFLLVTFVIGSVIDWRYQIIPDEINSLGLVAGMAFIAVTRVAFHLGIVTDTALSKYVGWEYPYLYSNLTLTDALLGLLAGAGSLYLFAEIGGMLARTDAMGGGDVKLAGYIGLFVGPMGILIALFYAMLIAAPCGVVILLAGKARKEAGFTKFAFGPYICAGAILVLYNGHIRMWNAYQAFNGLLLSLTINQNI
jgi:leader peptidase (prepilin peptidase)/N-methyltransferase